jgi:beta-lactamase regulating signal transducer with metallopeptidase domain
MTSFANWMPANVLQSLGWALVHFLWQGVALAAILSVAMAVSRSARTRYALAVGALILMVAAPLGTFFLELRAESEAAIPPNASGAMITGDGHATPLNVTTPNAARTAFTSINQKIGASNLSLPPGILFLLVEAWFAGVIFFSLRYAGGMVLIERLRRNDAKPVSAMLLEKCKALQVSLGLDRVIRYCECYRIDAPAVIGWFRPVVLLPAAVLTGLTEEQLTAVIAHELAHIQRLDSFVNLFQVAAETLLFYHPAIWWVNKRIRAERENCCDDSAISVCGDALEYARALTLMAERRAAPSLAMALNRSPLEARVMRLLGIGNLRGGIRTAGFAASFVCLAGAVFAGNAFLNNVGTSLGPADAGTVSLSATEKTTAVTEASVKTLAASAARSIVHSAVQTVMHSEWVAAVAQTQAAASSNGANQEAAAQETSNATQSAKESYIESMKAAGLQNLDVDDIVALKIQGVTADYVHAMVALNLKVDADTLVGMKVQGITAEYVNSIRDMGLQVDADGLIALKVQGITQDYVREMRAAGLDGDADAFIAMKVQSITPEYLKAIRDMGWKPSADDAIALKVQGITPEYVREMRVGGLDGDMDEFIAMKVQGITPQYAKDMRDLGLKPSTDELVAMRVQHVTPEYIRGIRATGLNPSGDEFVGMKVQGVTPEYIKALQAAGLKDLDADDVVGAKVQGVTPEFIEEARKHGFKDLDLEKLLALKRADVF